MTDKQRLLEELDRLRAVVERNEEDDSPELRRALVQTRGLASSLVLVPPERRELIRIAKKVADSLSTRCNNYKNGTIAKGVQIKPPATLRVHYAVHVAARTETLCDVLQTGRLVPCCGVSTRRCTVTVCGHGTALDPHSLRMELLRLDHWYTQDHIATSMLHCLQQVCERPGAPYTAEECMRRFTDQPRDRLQREMKNHLEQHLDMAKYRDDLFGSNLYLRCATCDKESKTTLNHPLLALNRYLL